MSQNEREWEKYVDDSWVIVPMESFQVGDIVRLVELPERTMVQFSNSRVYKAYKVIDRHDDEVSFKGVKDRESARLGI